MTASESAVECALEAYQVQQADEHMRQPEPTLQEALAEVTRLRAFLAEIAALQTEEPQSDWYVDAHSSQAFSRDRALYKAALMARAGLVSK